MYNISMNETQTNEAKMNSIFDTDVEVEIPIGDEDSKTMTITAVFDEDEPWFWGVEINGKTFDKHDLAFWFRDEVVANLPYKMDEDEKITNECVMVMGGE